MPSNYLTKAEAQDFITNSLHVPLTDQELLGVDLSVSLLQKICFAFTEHVPYSTMRYIPTPPEERELPTLEYVKHTGLNKLGGLCFETNVFLHWLLAGVGFDVDFLISKVFGSDFYNHALNVVRVCGKDYLADGGITPLMTENLICLDFDGDVSPISIQSIWEVRLKRHTSDDGQILFTGDFRWTENTAIPNWPVPIEDGWACLYNEVPYKRLSLAKLSALLRPAYMDPVIAPVISRLFCLIFPRGRLVMIRGTVLYYEEDGRQRTVVRTGSAEELVQLILKHFGEFATEAVVRRAVKAHAANGKVPDGWANFPDVDRGING
ncbi:hypothetical protein BV898_04947 [Hypsibius exemplaris]|uniref:arylamine N-acetyltransferase n=1 Tax=Hypsibius exemplaris TaxID=2072580 RepID=A0A1W0X171_HYPEX|nr:hypothetical protein BV898_04947 [Hypsibius exemplaris]